jgi:phosphatidylglycerol:prolipoprotein diacylglycerol transferase
VIAFYLPGGLPVYAYSLSLALGAALGLGLSAWVSFQPQQGSLERRLDVRRLRLDAGLALLAGCLVGARLAYALVHWGYFRQQPWEMLQFTRGGLAWPGALAGGLLALALFAALTRRPFGALAGALLPLPALLAAGAWMGCWFDGCAYGISLPGGDGLPAPDEYGLLALRFPVQPLGALASLGILWALDRLSARKRAPLLRSGGMKALVWLSALSLTLLALSFLRADPAPQWMDLRLESIAALIFLVVFTSAALLVIRSRPDGGAERGGPPAALSRRQ